MKEPFMVSIIIPAYNEEGAIGKDIDTIITTMEKAAYRYEVIVVDDGSTDNTAQVAKAKGVRLIQHLRNKGTGRATMTGIENAKGDVIVMTDADNSYPNQDIPRLLEHMDRYHMVVGARNTEAGSFSWLRRPAKSLIRKIAEYITNQKIPDLNSGFRAFRKEYALKFSNILPEGHSWVSTITIAFLNKGYDVKFIPIEYYRRKGKSTFHPIKDTYNYFMLVIKTVMYFKPLKIISPISTALFLLGTIRLLYDAKILHKIKESDTIIIMAAIIIGVLGLIADLIVKLHRENS